MLNAFSTVFLVSRGSFHNGKKTLFALSAGVTLLSPSAAHWKATNVFSRALFDRSPFTPHPANARRAQRVDCLELTRAINACAFASVGSVAKPTRTRFQPDNNNNKKSGAMHVGSNANAK